jgi:hypothetical protein
MLIYYCDVVMQASHESGEAITSDDIYEFFDKLKRKRARLTES